MALDLVVYDVEIAKQVKEVEGGWNNPGDMGLGSVVLYDGMKDRYYMYMHEKNKDQVISKLQDRLTLSFNGVNFDTRVLLGNDRKITFSRSVNLVHITRGNIHWVEFDILLFAIKAKYFLASLEEAYNLLGDPKIHDGALGLDKICKSTLGIGKTGHGAVAPVDYQTQEYDRLLSYNLQDVRLTWKLWLFIRQYSYVIDGSGQRLMIER
jgi:hypothetical protein